MRPKRLTLREVEALELLSVGFTTKQIARRLGENMQTVSSRVTRAQGKLGTNNRAHAVAVAMSSRLIRGPQPVECVVRNRRTLAEFAQDFKILDAQQLSRREIAEKLELVPSSLDKLLMRARKAGLLPQPAKRQAVSVR